MKYSSKYEFKVYLPNFTPIVSSTGIGGSGKSIGGGFWFGFIMGSSF